MKLSDYYICIPTYNEEKNLYRCISALNNEVKQIGNPIKTIICLNGCTDNSKQVAKKCQKIFPKLNIEVISSKKGKINAQQKSIRLMKSGKIVFFTDSDTYIKKNTLKNILEELDKNKNLIAVGGFPIAIDYSGANPLKILFDGILNIRSRHPMAEISKRDVSAFHKFAIESPQYINTSPEHEMRSKIFFHGRLFALRSKKYWTKPDPRKGVVGDDYGLEDI